MSIASQLTALEGNISDAYDMVAQRGGTVPARKNMENLDDAIATIPSGGGTFIGIPREVNAQGVYGVSQTITSFALPGNATKLGHYALYGAFYGSQSLTSVDMSSVTGFAVGDIKNACGHAFHGCSNLTSVDLSNLTEIRGQYAFQYAFAECTSLTSINLSSVTSISGAYSAEAMFMGCTSLTSVNLSGLQALYQYLNSTFRGCVNLTTVDFSSLSDIKISSAFLQTFNGCTSLSSLAFPSLTNNSFGSYSNQFERMLEGCSNVTLHFPSAIQTKVTTLTGYPNFGGTNTTVLFDL